MRFILILVITPVAASLFLSAAIAQQNPKALPRFENYPAAAIFTGKPARVNLASNPEARRFRTALTEAFTDSVTSSSKPTKIKVYLIAGADNGKNGKKIGCDDSLVAVTRTIQPTAAPLRAALDELLSLPEESNAAGQKFANYWKGVDLKVKSVSLTNGVATIQITGRLFVAGICDEPRITEQIEATAKQFPTVKTIRVFVNGIPLKEAIR